MSEDAPERPLVPWPVPVACVVATAVLVALRLAGAVSWSSWAVFSPLLGLGALVMAIAVYGVAADTLRHLTERLRKEP